MKAIKNDPKLPHVALAMDAEKMRHIFETHLPQFSNGQWRVISVDVSQFRYRPQKKVKVNYILHCSHPAKGEKESLIYSTLMLPDLVAKDKFKREKRKAYVAPSIGPAVHYISEVDMILWSFPNDPKIKNLSEVISESRLLEKLEQHRAEFGLSEESVFEEIKTEIIKYAPSTRCTLKHRLLVRDNEEYAKQFTIYSKSYSNKFSAAPLYEVLRELSNRDKCCSGELAAPKPLFYDEETNTIFMRELRGEHILGKREEVDLPAMAGKCGAALSDLQKCLLSMGENRSREVELNEFQKGVQTLLRSDENLRPRLDKISDYLQDALPRLPELALVPSHGAFRLPQLLDVDGKIGLVDFDGFLLADPAADVASFLTHLLYLNTKGEMEWADSLKIGHEFLRGYARHSESELPKEVLNWYAVVALVGGHAVKCVRVVKEDKDALIDSLLSMAEDIIAKKLVF